MDSGRYAETREQALAQFHEWLLARGIPVSEFDTDRVRVELLYKNPGCDVRIMVREDALPGIASAE